MRKIENKKPPYELDDYKRPSYDREKQRYKRPEDEERERMQRNPLPEIKVPYFRLTTSPYIPSRANYSMESVQAGTYTVNRDSYDITNRFDGSSANLAKTSNIEYN